MAIFEYAGLTPEGRKTKGIVDAESIRAARSKLKQKGVYLTDINERKSKERSSDAKGFSLNLEKKVSATDLALATRQLSTLVGAGMPLVESLKALGEQIDHPRLKTIFAEICTMVNEGSTFANAIEKYPNVFPRIYPNMIASAEASGTLEIVLDRLAELLEAQTALKRQLTAALAYPVLMLVLCFGVVILLLVYVVPQITEIFEEHGGILPLPTQIVIGLSDFFQSYWILLLVGIFLFSVSYRQYAATKKGRKKIDETLLKLPLVGSLTTKTATAQLSRTLGTMLSSGVELLTALTIVKNVIGNVVIEEAIITVREGVREGKSFSRELDRTGLFPRMLTHMTAVGEKTGELENMLLRAAKNYESEVDTTISALTAILNPILILILAGIVGMILVAVLLPMLEMTSLAA